MRELSVIAFIEFAEDQGDNDVDNTYWCTCAVGQYLLTHGIDVKEGVAELHTLVAPPYAIPVSRFYKALARVDLGECSLEKYLSEGYGATFWDIVTAYKEGL